MGKKKKRKLAAKLLARMQKGMLPNIGDLPESAREPMSKFHDMRSNLYIELYSKHFSEDQLQAQLDFYTSKMGKSILETQLRIHEESQSHWPELMQVLAEPKLEPDALKSLLDSVGGRRVAAPMKKKQDDSDDEV